MLHFFEEKNCVAVFLFGRVSWFEENYTTARFSFFLFLALVWIRFGGKKLKTAPVPVFRFGDQSRLGRPYNYCSIRHKNLKYIYLVTRYLSVLCPSVHFYMTSL